VDSLELARPYGVVMCGGTIVVAVMFGKSRKGKTTALRKYKTREIGIVINWRRPVGGGLCIVNAMAAEWRYAI
jgi:hypothetical protein